MPARPVGEPSVLRAAGRQRQAAQFVRSFWASGSLPDRRPRPAPVNGTVRFASALSGRRNRLTTKTQILVPPRRRPAKMGTATEPEPEPERQRHPRGPDAPDRCVGEGQLHAPCGLRSAQTPAPAEECSSTKNSFLRKLLFLLEDKRTTKKTASTGRFSMDEFMRRDTGRGEEDTTRNT